jgi:uncharacterized protein DUF3800
MTLKRTSGVRYVSDIAQKLTPAATDRSLFAMFKGFMDESGIGDTDLACTVAGFVGGELTCNKAEELWRELVKPIGYFHAEEFFRRDDGKMAGPYRGIDVEVAEDCVIQLIEMLRSSGLEPIGMSINANIFRTLTDNEKRYFTSAELYGRTWPQQPRDPYFPCFHYCVTQANQFTPNGEKVFLTFDTQALYCEKARMIYNNLKDLGGKWGEKLSDTTLFLSKKEVVLLQAADLLAYSIGQLLNEGNPNSIVQSVLDNLATNKDYVRAMDVKTIDEHLKDCPFRETFWKNLSDPDLIELIAAQGFETLTYKTPEGYITRHIKSEKVQILAALNPRPIQDSRSESD